MLTPLATNHRPIIGITDKIVRFNTVDRCLYSAPPLYTGKGRPRKHGRKFKLNDSSTWWKATETFEVEDVKLGRFRVRRWKVSRLEEREQTY